MKKIIFIIIVLAISSILYSQYYDSYDIGKWNLVEKIDPITDEKEISLYIKAQEQNSLNYNTLYIKITKDSININIYTPSLLFKERFSDDDKIDLIYRLDKNEPRSMILNKYGESEVYSLTDNEITSGRSIVFLKELISSDLLAIRALEQIGSAKHTYTYVYDLKQLRELLLNANFDNTMNYIRQDLTIYTDDAYLWRANWQNKVSINANTYFSFDTQAEGRSEYHSDPTIESLDPSYKTHNN